MSPLKDLKCIPCRGGEPALDEAKVQELLSEVPAWQVVEEDNVPKLQRVFTFPGFKEALRFASLVGEAAEAENHHPNLEIGWGRVKVTWWTHVIHGLHQNDFIMAARTDDIARKS